MGTLIGGFGYVSGIGWFGFCLDYGFCGGI